MCEVGMEGPTDYSVFISETHPLHAMQASSLKDPLGYTVYYGPGKQ